MMFHEQLGCVSDGARPRPQKEAASTVSGALLPRESPAQFRSLGKPQLRAAGMWSLGLMVVREAREPLPVRMDVTVESGTPAPAPER